MKYKILVIGSTGKLGSRLLNYCKINQIKIDTITSFKNEKLQKKHQVQLKIKNAFCLSKNDEVIKFKKFLKSQRFTLVYFLDFGCFSLAYLNLIIMYNSNTQICIANKEMIIAGGNLLVNKIKSSGNNLVPMDSEHFSMTNSNTNNNDIEKIYITASGGPFYFKKKINLSNVSLKKVLKHPKWDMGINNSIDSSNFINKILEILELSILFEVDLNKISFLVSKEAYVHSLILYKNSTVTINCFENNMMIPLISPLVQLFNSKKIKTNFKKNLEIKNFKLELMNDKRFEIVKYFDRIKKFSHFERIYFLLLNNRAHLLYLNNKIKYNNIINFIFKKIPKNIHKKKKLNTFNDIINYMDKIKKEL